MLLGVNMSSNKKIQKTVSLTPEIHEKVKAYADKLGIPHATAITVLVAKALEYEEMQETVRSFNANASVLEDMKKALEGISTENAKGK